MTDMEITKAEHILTRARERHEQVTVALAMGKATQNDCDQAWKAVERAEEVIQKIRQREYEREERFRKQGEWWY